MASLTSLEKYVNRSVIFVQGIERNAPKGEVLALLGQVCRQPAQGRIDILTAPGTYCESSGRRGDISPDPDGRVWSVRRVLDTAVVHTAPLAP